MRAINKIIWTKIVSFCIWLILFLSCNDHSIKQDKPIVTKEDTYVQYRKYIDSGNKYYAERKGINSYEMSVIFFDSALMLAKKAKDSNLIVNAIFAQARFYDAWNQEKLKTIEYYQYTLDHYYKIDTTSVTKGYFAQLLANAYYKADSINACMNIINQIIKNLEGKTLGKEYNYLVRVAWLATLCKAYDVSNNILINYVDRATLANDPETYRYLDMYYHTLATNEIIGARKEKSLFLDSFYYTLSDNIPPLDSIEYLDNIAALYHASNDSKKAYELSKLSQSVKERLVAYPDIISMKNKILNLELENNEQLLAKERKIRNISNMLIILGSIVITLISILLYFLNKNRKRLLTHLSEVKKLNNALDDSKNKIAIANKEIQHRVKNNLQLVFGLLNMQERKSTNPEVISNLQIAKMRIESIATLHEMLLHNEQKKNINFKEYIHKIIENILNCTESDYKIMTDIEVDNINLENQNYQFSLGLIINEWITNSLKYARPIGNTLYINLAIRNEIDSIVITYNDNGIIDEYANKSSSSLGTEIIKLLAKQMKSNLSNINNKPYYYQLIIPK